jgi:hypothetical protein
MRDFPNIGKCRRGAKTLAAAFAFAGAVRAGAEAVSLDPLAEPVWPSVEWAIWRRGPDFMAPVREKDEQEWTEEEREVRRRLQKEVRREWPADCVEFDDGSEWEGCVIERTADGIVFEKRYGPSGRMKVTLPLNRVRAVREAGSPPRVTYRDVQFRMQFPDLFFRKAPPYTAVSDAGYLEVEDAVSELRRLYREIVRVFDPLIASTARREDIQVLFFSDRTRFEEYCKRSAPDLGPVSGFYNPWMDRLVWFHQRESETVARAREWLAAEEKQNRERYAGRPDAQAQIAEWKRRMENRIEAFAWEMTTRTLRHEGAHQLFFSLGVHSKHLVEGDWLYEGLASYAEVRPLGARNPERTAVLREALEAGRLIPLAALMRAKGARGLAAFGEPDCVELAYSEAWGLVACLMEPARRVKFFEYLDYVRAPENVSSVTETDPLELLCRFLKEEPNDFEKNWIEWIRTL